MSSPTKIGDPENENKQNDRLLLVFVWIPAYAGMTMWGLNLFHLQKIKFHGRFPAEH